MKSVLSYQSNTLTKTLLDLHMHLNPLPELSYLILICIICPGLRPRWKRRQPWPAETFQLRLQNDLELKVPGAFGGKAPVI